jgi:hypothetical protein
MLEFALPAGGLRGITLTGALLALQERKIVPEIVTGVSAGAYAAYMVYGGLDQEQIFNWFLVSRDHFRTRRGLWRFLPPYDSDAKFVTDISRPYLIDSQKFRDAGLKKFYVGYTKLPNFRFIMEDIINEQDKVKAYQSVVKSSLVPFITNYAPHCQGAIDGGFRRLYFTSPDPSRQRWLFTFDQYALINARARKVNRKIILKSPVRSLVRATDQELRDGFDAGYEQGWLLKL